MKKISILSVVALVIFGSFFGCKPKDDKAPKIYFSSDVETSQDWVLQEYYTLPSATASDNVDGDLTGSISIANDLVFYELRSDSIAGQTVYVLENKIKNGTEGYVGKAGKYAIVYSATDAAGNTGSKTLNVNVLNSLNSLAYNGNGDKITYKIERTYVGGTQQRIGGVYDQEAVTQKDEYEWIDEKPVTTTFSPDKKVNYKLKISKIANIGGLALYVNFNRFSTNINFDNTELLKEEYSKVGGVYVKTEFVYVTNQMLADGPNEYNPENNSFAITYQIERWKEDPSGSKVFDDRTWKVDRKCIYTEAYTAE